MYFFRLAFASASIPAPTGPFPPPPPPLVGRVENWRADSLGSGVYAFRCFRSVPSPAPVTTFPAPASSNTACGFPALCFPVVFIPRFMWPIDWGTLSTADKATAYSTSSSQMSAFALRYILFLRSCRPMDGFIIPSLPPLWSEKRQQQGAFAPRELPRLNATTRPSATLSSSTHFPVLPVIGPTLLRQFPAGTRRASPVLGLSLSSCHRYHPAEVGRPYQSAFDRPCRLRPPVVGSAFGMCTFEATCAFTCVAAR